MDPGNTPTPNPSIATAPHPLSALRTAYITSYNDENADIPCLMAHGTAFALRLLQHYFPPSDGYTVHRTPLPSHAQDGLSVLLQAPDGSDPHPSTSIIDAHLRFQHIDAASIAVFVVLHTRRVATILALVIDDPLSLTQHTTTTGAHRSDLLADEFARAGVQHGAGILLYGTTLECYETWGSDAQHQQYQQSLSVGKARMRLCTHEPEDLAEEELSLDLQVDDEDVCDWVFGRFRWLCEELMRVDAPVTEFEHSPLDEVD